jgi:excisionase family DNA binding protein
MSIAADEKFLPHPISDVGAQEFKLLFSQKDAARILGVSLRTLQNLIASKQLPVRRIGRRVLVHRKDLESFARRDHIGVVEEKCNG